MHYAVRKKVQLMEMYPNTGYDYDYDYKHF